ncbi:hypothetical protein [Falsirhodobacter sp. 20TX0035]|uniref:hypothetical protein n=1 Tax=Falsirhodobacter sp. 20TX0035 TaxID=3022019 RepID=UPI00233095E8|nr:hypothetical protein [Falsirhodobacter sp. 20TX0035]MDB6454522.1 hypothetical protein [Falsirhodobacter sp. 20TX0035]
MKLRILLLCLTSLAPVAAQAQYLPAPSAEEREQDDNGAVAHGHKPMTDEEHEDAAEDEAGALKPTLVQPDAQDPGENTDPQHDGHPGQPQGRE